jgi:uncharacterized protein (DUF2249 family)
MNETLTEHLIDVRTIPPGQRHPTIFGTWARLAPGEAILLVNDHDPVPLYHPVASERTGTFRWEYLERGPKVFRVRIAKGDFAESGFVPASGAIDSCCGPSPVPIEFVKPLVLDTRPIFARGESPCRAIDDAVASLIPGQLFVLLAPFEPVPLYAKLGNKGFSASARQVNDSEWRVEFRKGN